MSSPVWFSQYNRTPGKLINVVTNGQIKNGSAFVNRLYYFLNFFYHFNLSLILDFKNSQRVPKYYADHVQIFKLIETEELAFEKWTLLKCPLFGPCFKFTHKNVYLLYSPSSEHSLLYSVLPLFGNIVKHLK